MLYVSHDQLEAMTMADRIVLINAGRVEQIAAPQILFDRPETLFAATFVGEPVMNTLPARLGEHDGRHVLEIGRARIPVDRAWIGAGETLRPGVTFTIGIRPQQLELCATDDPSAGRVDGTVFAVETLGSRVIFDVDVDGTVVRVMTSVDTARGFPRAPGAPIAFRVDPDFVYLFDAGTGRTVRQARFTRTRLT
jgi:ABC-type sugar transport system ATPase subunit